MLYLCYKKFLFVKKTARNAFYAHNIVHLTFLFHLMADAGMRMRRIGIGYLHPEHGYVIRIAKYHSTAFLTYGQQGRIAVIA